MEVEQNQKTTLFWFKFLMIFKIIYAFFPILTSYAYELGSFFEEDNLSISEFNEKEIFLYEGIFSLSEEQLYILLALVILHPILLFFRFRIAKVTLPFFILLSLIFGIQGILFPFEFYPFTGLDSYVEGIADGLLIYLCYFSSIKNTFNRKSFPKFIKKKT